MKIKLPVLVLTIALMLTLPSLAQAATLGQGSTGPSVVNLQTQLNTEGYTVGLADGIFGPKTAKGVALSPYWVSRFVVARRVY